ncbi:NgoFVII family restriction endonuclease [Bacillus altitudinis]|uniref:NgoFVII family restriction endonuclease n=1 Tax=Bacillus TaxID=1386 RepID=UPI001074CD73|nr:MULTISPECIES: NgoFVII family restriction endonuclease [Bacillus]MCA0925297.1 NgoFVII family restriction endonuclease [Bacillus stratosphericus]QQX14414.1 NgoFVII family restriction endonuclease [Bacillus altitudinis]TFW48064.1 NgoFVII family restriction endonuclease [Bacillus sp. 005/A4HT-01/001]UJM26578.1 NgoFVII family restriction endonuclease [Bacillus aerophilus]
MLFNTQSAEKQKLYINMLMSAGALSNLFSDNTSPYIVSRNVENAYCEAFGADNLGRSDCSADASLEGIGVGIKTFIHGNGRTLQKVAEFNKDAELYRNKMPKELINTVALLRNERIDFTMRTYELSSMIYHCVTRKPGKILVFEFTMDKINIDHIRNVSLSNKNTITFEDGINEYSFNITKSTLYKRFNTVQPLVEIDVDILENPYTILSKLVNVVSSKAGAYEPTSLIGNNTVEVELLGLVKEDLDYQDKKEISKPDFISYVILPLFSDRGNKRHVPEKSGLNQWNASGRSRHYDEVYIPIPKWIHDAFPTFFPKRDDPFNLRLPDKSLLSAKVCQDNSKALMSNPNKDLGEWMLRKVLNLKPGELLNFEYLQVLGIDSVIVYKHSKKHFSIEFCDIGSYDDFQSEWKKHK